MSRANAAIVAVVVAFLVVGGYMIFGRLAGGSAEALTVDVTVTGTTMSPNPISVKQNDRVTMNVTVDRKEEIHLHGYDIKFEATRPGDTVTHTFTADKTGNFDIEIEDTGTGIGSLQVLPG
jgi:hypothetical protein